MNLKPFNVEVLTAPTELPTRALEHLIANSIGVHICSKDWFRDVWNLPWFGQEGIMPHMRFARLALVAILLSLSLMLGSSSAWEFSMEGEVVWKNRFVGQLGSNGFFGKYDLDNSSTARELCFCQRLGERQTQRSVVVQQRCGPGDGNKYSD